MIVIQTQSRRAVFCISNSPQNRHPERSASQIYRVTQRLMARSPRTPRVLILPMLLGAFQPLNPALGGPATVFRWGREQELLASCYGRGLHLHSRQPIQAPFTLASPATCISVSCNIRKTRWKVSLRPMAASACSTLRVRKTFAQPSLGKNNSKAGGAKRSSTSFARSIPSAKILHRPGDGG
jgi:hypothetical protein